MTQKKGARNQLNVTLADEQRATLQRLADEEGTTVSALIRQAVIKYLQSRNLR